eukprot:scaffold567_cov170-Amphora_coffeaeformis.AAC.13
MRVSFIRNRACRGRRLGRLDTAPSSPICRLWWRIGNKGLWSYEDHDEQRFNSKKSVRKLGYS